MTDNLEIDGDMRYYLNELQTYWPHTDDGHIIRKLLKERIKVIEAALRL